MFAAPQFCGEIVTVFVQGAPVILPGQLARVMDSSYHVADESLGFSTFHNWHRSRPNGSHPDPHDEMAFMDVIVVVAVAAAAAGTMSIPALLRLGPFIRREEVAWIVIVVGKVLRFRQYHLLIQKIEIKDVLFTLDKALNVRTVRTPG
jgi:hypothetical protein